MTVRACVIGYPVTQSRSPRVHGFWLKKYKIDGIYDRAEVTPDDFAGFIAGLAVKGYSGGNITVPHKEEAFHLVATRSDPVARALGAVNTVWFENGALHGQNTDAEGFLANLDESAPGWDRSLVKAVVLGAGGAARAVVYGLLKRGADTVLVINRSRERAKELQSRFGSRVRITDWGAATMLDEASILVNTTSLGMTGQPPLALDLTLLPPQALVTDLVYAPLETALLTQAKARGHPIVNGLGMLLHQAAPGFERWFGVRPKVTLELRQWVAADLRGKAS